MKQTDVNRSCRIFDRPDGRGLVGTITEVYDDFNFRFKTDTGREYEFSIKNVTVHFLNEGGDH